MSEGLAARTGARIRAEREAASLTQYDLAVMAGVSPVSVCRWELGSRCPSLHHLMALAAALEVAPGSLLPGWDVPGA